MEQVKIVKDSINERGVRITTFELIIPRYILSEINTHRKFSRNSSSSRAVPFKVNLKKLRSNPFKHTWMKSHKGMQSTERLEGIKVRLANLVWSVMFKTVKLCCNTLFKFGVAKSQLNRFLEPFSYHKMIVTSTEWDNFFLQRCHEDCEHEFRKVALQMQELLKSNNPIKRKYHFPYVDDRQILEGDIDKYKRVSAARCARVSYTDIVDNNSYEKDLELCNKLIEANHHSPFEHQATYSENKRNKSNFHWSWMQYRKEIEK